MISRKEILDYTLSIDGAVFDKPFPDDFDTTVLRHSDTRKWFGAIIKAPKCKLGLSGDGEADILNLKCDPALSQGLRDTYQGIIPAWHMNKYHWISVILDSDVDITTLTGLINLSFSLTLGKVAQKKPQINSKLNEI